MKDLTLKFADRADFSSFIWSCQEFQNMAQGID